MKDKQKTWIINIIFIVLVVAVVVWTFLPGGGDGSGTGVDSDVITLGFIGPLTGDLATLGQNAQASVAMAIEEINDAGGIDGKQLEVIYEDSRCNARDASSAGNKLIKVDDVSVIIGGLCSSETLAVAPIAEEEGTVMLSYCSSSPDITDAGDYIFRNYPSDAFQGVFLADYLYNDQGLRKIGVIYCLSDYCVGVRDTFKERFEELGGEIVNDEGVEQTSTDLRTTLTKVKNEDPDGVFFVAYTESSIAGIKQYKELGIEVPLFGVEVWEDPAIWDSVGSAGDGIIFSSLLPATLEFQQKLMERTGESDTTICAAQAYDAIKIIAKVIEEVGTDSEAIKNALYNVEYEGASGSISFDENGDLPEANYLLKEVVNGEPVVL